MFATPSSRTMFDSVEVSYVPSFGGNLYGPSQQSSSGSCYSAAMPSTRTQSPIVTGTSVVAVKFDGGIVLAADTLGSYGSLARFMKLDRMHQVNSKTLVAAGGEYSDFQELVSYLDNRAKVDFLNDDGSSLSPVEIHKYLQRVMYNRRNKMDPFWNQVVVAGFDDKPFLGYVDMHGTAYPDETIATGYGAYIAQPLLRKAHDANPHMTMEQAVAVVEESMRVLFYRDARAINRIQMARITAEGITISEPYSLSTEWSHGESKAARTGGSA